MFFFFSESFQNKELISIKIFFRLIENYFIELEANPSAFNLIQELPQGLN
jgi:hypothetical protein